MKIRSVHRTGSELQSAGRDICFADLLALEVPIADSTKSITPTAPQYLITAVITCKLLFCSIDNERPEVEN